MKACVEQKMVSVYKRKGQKIYQACWEDAKTNTRVYRSTGETRRRDALQVARVMREAQNESGDKSLEELLELWISELEYLGRTPKHTRERRHSVEVLGFDVHQANKLMGERARTGVWSDRTVRMYYSALKQFGIWCVENGHRDKNPMRGLKRPARRTGRVYVRGVLTKEHASILCSHPAIPEHRRLVYKTALSTGLRIGELRKLKRMNLKFAKGQYYIHLKPRDVKNRFESVLPISQELYEHLQNGLDLRQFSKAARRLRQDLQLAGLSLKDDEDNPIDFHSLRGTFANVLIHDGASIPTVARLMRHSDGGSLLLKRYATGDSLRLTDETSMFRLASC
jgi:integrase/recombinase XerC